MQLLNFFLDYNNFVTVTDLREKTVAVIKKVQKSTGPIIIFYRSKPMGVFLSIKKFNSLINTIRKIKIAND